MTKVFKFGGASVKDAEGFRNVGKIIHQAHLSTPQIVVVLSALGKTTNALEAIHQAAWNNTPNWQDLLANLQSQHLSIIENLGFDKDFLEIDQIFSNLFKFCQDLSAFAKEHKHSFDSSYDKVVSLGELLSSLILEKTLTFHYSKHTKWLDARELVITDSTFRAAKVDEALTYSNIIDRATPFIQSGIIVVTQGFIGRSMDGQSTTLGREGSDFTGSLFASALKADSLTIWKDVPGVLSADPKLFASPVLYEALSYQQAAEMTYYGASVIHPKTIKPLSDSGIPLWVKSFSDPAQRGTLVGPKAEIPSTPAFIVKSNQVLISLTTKDLAFSTEIDVVKVLETAIKIGLSINMMQNSAVSFSIVVDANESKIQKFKDLVGKNYSFQYNDNLQMVTIKYYNQEAINSVESGKTKILVQQTRTSYQVLFAS